MMDTRKTGISSTANRRAKHDTNAGAEHPKHGYRSTKRMLQEEITNGHFLIVLHCGYSDKTVGIAERKQKKARWELIDQTTRKVTQQTTAFPAAGRVIA